MVSRREGCQETHSDIPYPRDSLRTALIHLAGWTASDNMF